ncbi:hypothetical protein [Zavarzinella formosa]|uniref:hypothetical protein n=1 Tax=Zavarzinella formosa TaxID=360055 RepID=UPI0002E56A8D|nr:hypothetical protein [Zavarzinella formosa]
MAAILALAGIIGLPDQAAAQTSLQRIHGLFHQEVFPKPPAPPSNTLSDFRWLGTGDDAFYTLALIGVVVTSPVWVPATLFDSGYNVDCRWPAYPYMREEENCSVLGYCPKGRLENNQYWDNPLCVKEWSLRSSLEVGNDFAGVNRLGGELFLDTNYYRLGFLSHVNYYRETAQGSTADALMTDANVTFRAVQNNSMFLHVGFGGRMWNSFDETHGGVNFLYRADFFPLKPLHITMIGEAGNLDKLLFTHLHANIGFIWRHGEVFLGYDWTHISRVDLQGPTIGLRLWF